jgi:hypothetical protein
MITFFEFTGRPFILIIEEFGSVLFLFLSTVTWFFRPPFRFRVIFKQSNRPLKLPTESQCCIKAESLHMDLPKTYNPRAIQCLNSSSRASITLITVRKSCRISALKQKWIFLPFHISTFPPVTTILSVMKTMNLFFRSGTQSYG